MLVEIDKKKIVSMLPEKVIKKYNHFQFCTECKKIYWIGSHWENMKKTIEKVGVGGQGSGIR